MTTSTSSSTTPNGVQNTRLTVVTPKITRFGDHSPEIRQMLRKASKDGKLSAFERECLALANSPNLMVDGADASAFYDEHEDFFSSPDGDVFMDRLARNFKDDPDCILQSESQQPDASLEDCIDLSSPVLQAQGKAYFDANPTHSHCPVKGPGNFMTFKPRKYFA